MFSFFGEQDKPWFSTKFISDNARINNFLYIARFFCLMIEGFKDANKPYILEKLKGTKNEDKSDEFKKLEDGVKCMGNRSIDACSRLIEEANFVYPCEEKDPAAKAAMDDAIKFIGKKYKDYIGRFLLNRVDVGLLSAAVDKSTVLNKIFCVPRGRKDCKDSSGWLRKLYDKWRDLQQDAAQKASPAKGARN